MLVYQRDLVRERRLRERKRTEKIRCKRKFFYKEGMQYFVRQENPTVPLVGGPWLVPDFSGEVRLATKGGATRIYALIFVFFCGEGGLDRSERGEIGEAWFGGVRTRGMGRDGLKVVMESVEKVELESRHWLHDGDLFQEVEKFGEVDLPFAPYLDCWKVSLRSLEEGLTKTLMNKKKRSGEDEESKGCCGLNKGRDEER
ncbi:hypothetical protein Tco_0639478 [Tanacetum coccineum]